MKKILLLLLMMYSPTLIFSQNRISGRVIDQNGNPVAYANIVVTNSLSEGNLGGTITGEYGNFVLITKEQGLYEIAISFVGYKTWVETIFLSPDKDLGVIVLQYDETALKEITLKGNRPLIERKVDRLVFNVEQSVAASGGDAIDALRLTPRLRVRNDQIEMIGKSGMRILIDGRLQFLAGEDLVNLLSTISSDDIKSIEVINNPPAKYSAEGNSGLINIKLKKSIADAWSASVRSQYRQGVYSTKTIGGNFNYSQGKIKLTSSINFSDGAIETFLDTRVHYPEVLWIEEHDGKRNNRSGNIRLSTDYIVSDKVKIGVNYNWFDNNTNGSNHIKTAMESAFPSPDSLYLTESENDINKVTHTLNTHLKYEMDTLGRVFSIDLDYLGFENNTKNSFVTNTVYPGHDDLQGAISARNDGIQGIHNYSASLDMEHPLDWIKFNYGGRLSFTETRNNFLFYPGAGRDSILTLERNNKFDYKENTQAFYFSAEKKLSKQWEAKVGLRVESTQTQGDQITTNERNSQEYVEFFPTAYLSYNLSNDHSFALNYGRRINRPSFRYLNPFRWVSSPYSYEEGNPNLRPSFINNLEFEHTYKGNFTTSVYFSSISNGFEQLTVVDGDSKVQRLIPLNFITNHTFGIYEYISLNPQDWWDLSFQASIYYSSSKSSISQALDFLSGWNADFYLSNDFKLNSNKTTYLNFSYGYISEGVYNLDRNTDSSQLNIALKLFFLDKKLQFTVYGNDIFRTAIPRYTTYTNNIKTSFKSYYDQQYIRFSLKYDLGGSINSLKERSGNRDEKSRSS